MPLKIIAAFAAFTSLCLAAPALAGFPEGKAALDRGDYATAYRELRPAAEQGNARAAAYVADMLWNGRGVSSDRESALSWYRKAIAQGDSFAQFNLAYILSRGDGIARDPAQAAALFSKGAERGEPDAQYQLARMLYLADGVPHDPVRAAYLARKSAASGYQLAQILLGGAYYDGSGVVQNKQIAATLYWVAVDNTAPLNGSQQQIAEGRAEAQRNFDTTSQYLTQQQVSDAVAMADDIERTGQLDTIIAAFERKVALAYGRPPSTAPRSTPARRTSVSALSPCVQQRAAAYHKVNGASAVVTTEMIEEWKGACAARR